MIVTDVGWVQIRNLTIQNLLDVEFLLALLNLPICRFLDKTGIFLHLAVRKTLFM